MNNVKTILEKARAFIEKGWVQGILAVNDKGEAVSAGNDTATCFCALGALDRAVLGLYGEATEATEEEIFDAELKASNHLHEAMRELDGTLYTIDAFNDNHSKEEVLKAFDRAIQLAQEE